MQWHPLFAKMLRPIVHEHYAVEPESVPLHLAAEESRESDLALARVIVEEPRYWELFGSLLNALHPNIWKEAKQMAKLKKEA
jgi:hypothetical protein